MFFALIFLLGTKAGVQVDLAEGNTKEVKRKYWRLRRGGHKLWQLWQIMRGHEAAYFKEQINNLKFNIEMGRFNEITKKN
jgi:hypothetical protein